MPSGVIMLSQFPWSAVMRHLPSISRIFSTTGFRHLSTVSTALIAAGRIPVWPTMSGFA